MPATFLTAGGEGRDHAADRDPPVETACRVAPEAGELIVEESLALLESVR